MADILDELIVAPSGEQGVAPSEPSLALKLGSMLDEVEALLGARDHGFTILGFEFAGDTPRLWYPSRRQIVIRLGLTAMTDSIQAEFQLAHESVHLIDPVARASVLEEGIATYYSLQRIWERCPGFESGDEKYDAACSLAMSLLEKAPGAVKQLRNEGKRLSEITSQELMGLASSLGEEEAVTLTQPFLSWIPS